MSTTLTWLEEFAAHSSMDVSVVGLDELPGWGRDPATGNIRHHSGKFFTVEGLEVSRPEAPVSGWTQPIINQPEVGILGILSKRFDGVPHYLMQAKIEPGNRRGLQLSPTVQATRSNYTRVHQGRPVPYLDYFRDTSRHRVLTDVRQSEQGAWFYRKRNRNMVVEVAEEVELLDGFRWLTLAELHELLAVEDLVNMDARTVLSCLPYGLQDGEDDDFHRALARSFDPRLPGVHTMGDVLTWITDRRSVTDVVAERIPLNSVRGWELADGRVSHETGCFFDVIGVNVEARGREVQGWAQPMIKPIGEGVVAFLVAPIDGVLHVLMHARTEPGYADVVELAPTVQCTPENYWHLPPTARPAYLDQVLGADPAAIRYDTILSEEGGRFHHALNRYVVIEVDAGFTGPHPEYRWLTVHQLGELMRHSYYMNVQARSLMACLHSLTTTRLTTASRALLGSR
ncbi:NDP-hexose 2,3-dehydratase family protein [Planobispora rosea]|uniref:NDP-hexose 2,3-dehydratase family protein n=1 Tax=Planobispora rosea TaxID=35762 RepID=UPI000A05AC90|nr:NDP-hexose 2,3-dehydratase family protein [Planobispora rosea]